MPAAVHNFIADQGASFNQTLSTDYPLSGATAREKKIFVRI